MFSSLPPACVIRRLPSEEDFSNFFSSIRVTRQAATALLPSGLWRSLLFLDKPCLARSCLRRDMPRNHSGASLSGTFLRTLARTGYATEGALLISAQLSSNTVSALRKVWVLIKLQALVYDIQGAGKRCSECGY